MNFLYWLKGKPKFCSVCGSKLEKIEKIWKFDSNTGKAISKKIIKKCPNFECKIVAIYLFGDGEKWEDNGHDYYSWTEKV